MNERNCPYCGERLKIVDEIDDMESTGPHQICNRCKVTLHYVGYPDGREEWEAYVYNSVSFQPSDMLIYGGEAD